MHGSLITSKKIDLLLLCAGCLLLTNCAGKKTPSPDPWKKVKKIKSQIHPPEFPDHTFLITDYGAVGDGKTLNTKAFKKAIAACHKQGGGKVVVPKGVFLTGAIHLKSNVNLHLKKGATILFTQDSSDYLPMVRTHYEGIELWNYSPFIYAYKKKNIAITGQGTLDGNADKDHWWPWTKKPKDREYLGEMNKKQTPVKKREFGAGHYLRPVFIQPFDCKNVLIKGVTIRRSPMWEINPVLSENVIVSNVHIKSLGPNNDGIDPESSKNVWIKNCYFNTGDDCIAIKSGRNQDGRRIGKPSENIIIEDSRMKNGHGGIVIGSEVSGGVNNVYAQHLTMSSPNLERVLRIKTSSKRGGVIQNIYMRNVQVGTYKEAAIKVSMFYGPPGNFMPTVKNIIVDNLHVKKGGKYGLYIKAYKESPVKNITVKNSTIEGVKVPIKVDHVKNMQLKNVVINGKKYNRSE
jgi:polygalacturonase